MSKSDLFMQFPDGVQQDMVDEMTWIAFEAGTVLVPQQCTPNDVLLLAHGTAVVVNDEEAEHQSIRANLAAGDIYAKQCQSGAVVATTHGMLGLMTHDQFLGLVSDQQPTTKVIARQVTGNFKRLSEIASSHDFLSPKPAA